MHEYNMISLRAHYNTMSCLTKAYLIQRLLSGNSDNRDQPNFLNETIKYYGACGNNRYEVKVSEKFIFLYKLSEKFKKTVIMETIGDGGVVLSKQ